MHFLAQALFLLFSCTSQLVTSLLTTPHIGSSGEASEQILHLEQVHGSGRESWPWSKTPSASTQPTWAESGQGQTTQPAVDAKVAGSAVVSRGLEPWTPELSELNELDRMLKEAEQEMPQESGPPPATEAEQELLEGRRAQVQSMWARDKLRAEVKDKQRELSEFIQATRSQQQAAKQQELNNASETHEATAQAAEQAARDAQALQAAETQAAQQALVEHAAQERMQEFRAQVEAKQREISATTAEVKDLEAEQALKQHELKEANEALPAKLQSAAQAALGLKALQDARAQAAEQVRAAQDKARAKFSGREHELLERRQKLEAQVDAKTRELREANATALAEELAAEQGAQDVHRTQLSQAQAAERALAAQAEAETEAKQREVRVLEKEQSLEAEVEAKRRELLQAAEAVPAAEATRVQHFKQTAEAMLFKPKAETAEDNVKAPTLPGCYVRVPSGCPMLRMSSEEWREDSWAEQHGLDKGGCQRRKGIWDKYCGSTDTQMAFVAKATHSD